MTEKRFRQVLHWGTKTYRTGCGREGNSIRQQKGNENEQAKARKQERR